MTIDGKEYLPDHRGRYYCPNKCGNPDWPAPHWSTEKGFAGHMAKCKGKSDNLGGWTPPPEMPKVLWGLCSCGEVIYEGDTVTMYGDHDQVACIACFETIPDAHVDCAGLKFPEITLSQ